MSEFLAPTVSYRLGASPFSIDATLRGWLVTANEIQIAIESGTLIDLDKGSFCLAGIEVKLRAEGWMVPIGMVSTAGLSELQVAVVMEAVTSYLNQPGLSYRVDSGGLHVTAGDRTFHFSPLKELC